MENNQTYINDFKNIINANANFSINDSMDENSSYLKLAQKIGEIEMIVNEPYVDYNDDDNNYNSDHSQYANHVNDNNKLANDSDSELSEFIAYIMLNDNIYYINKHALLS